MSLHSVLAALQRQRRCRSSAVRLAGLAVLVTATQWVPAGFLAGRSFWTCGQRAKGSIESLQLQRRGRAMTAGSTSAAAAAAEATLSSAPLLEDVSVQAQLERLFQQALDSLPIADKSIQAQVVAADARFGDYQCNQAMGIFKKQKAAGASDWKNPKAVGEAIKAALPEEANAMLASVEVSPQGFVTLQLNQAWLEDQVKRVYHSGSIAVRAQGRQRIVIDYSSPNIAKEMHVGHLRSTILGDTVANLLEMLGHDVVRLNHVGDWGTQFGMLLEYLKRESGTDGDYAISDLQTFYRNAKVAFDEDAGFKSSSQANVVALQSGESWAREAWGKICEASRNEFQLIYQRLGISNLKERGESFYNDMLPSTLEELEKKGLVKEDAGAKLIFTEVSEAPLIVQKNDGGYGYDSTDCAAVLQRLRDEKADRVIYVIDSGQEMHMKMVFEVAERAGWLAARRLDFMGFGLVQGEDGKKFKTRSGDTVKLKSLLDEAADRAEVELRKRAEERQTETDATALRSSAEQIGVAAVKYFDLRQNRQSNYKFSYDAMLDPKGHTAVYVLYAYARLSAILARSGRDVSQLDPSLLQLEKPSERALALRLARLPEVLAQVEDDLLPSRLVDYLYGLAGDFTSFYTECPVVGSPEEASRLLLCEATRTTLQGVLRLIGISPLERL
eukprot:TRINITY_DN30168_c0_g1_i1.p1 TRINITY_DN30168_c0_g1~~TRINITY_DN30168_c0_g1_i1.p1  ORF type:complete len:671 (+),score=188.59 TRINITY_DN30168_c0_g1_i1:169-2181(+)